MLNQLLEENTKEPLRGCILTPRAPKKKEKGHAFYLNQNAEFIDENKKDASSLEQYCKGYFLIPKNFTESKKKMIPGWIKNNPNLKHQFSVKDIMQRIREKLFDN